MSKTKGYAAITAKASLAPFSFERREPQEHDVACDIGVIPIQIVNEAYERVQKSDVRYRFVIDMASLKTP